MYVSKHGPEQTNVHQSKSFLKKAIDEFHLPLPKMQLSVYIEASVTQTLTLSANCNPHEFLQQIHSHELIPAFWRFGLKVFSAQNDNEMFALLHLRIRTPFHFRYSMNTAVCLFLVTLITHNSRFQHSSSLCHRWHYMFGVHCTVLLKNKAEKQAGCASWIDIPFTATTNKEQIANGRFPALLRHWTKLCTVWNAIWQLW